MDPAVAKRQMIAAVDEATGHLGDTWKGRTGPDYPEDCRLPDGDQGARWRYLTGRDRVGSPEDDATRLEDLWKAAGMKVSRRDTSDGPVVFASGGGKIASINAYAYSGNYTVQALSLCFPGDADEISEDLADGAG